MEAVVDFAGRGGLVIGICNGFQVLCEAGLLPGALLRNDSLEFRCEWVNLRVDNSGSVFTGNCESGQRLRVPISHGEGRYYADDVTLSTLDEEGRVLFRYCAEDGAVSPEANPNGSLNGIAGIMNREGNVLGMMPHPERCCELVLGGTDGLYIFESIVGAAVSS